MSNLKFIDSTIFIAGISKIMESINDSIVNKNKKCITYFNANSFNLNYNNPKLTKIFNQFDIIHPDGIGVYLASRFLCGKKGFTKRVTGSDLYIQLIEFATINNWSFFIFGDTDATLKRISELHPKLKLVGIYDGFNYNNDVLISAINNSNPDILIVGLGSPKQEDWIINYKNYINAKVIIAVGDGIKIFAGTKKRGPKIIQKIGLEWFVRFLYEPKRLWKRYFIGIPLFIFRVIKFKFSNYKNTK